MRRISNHLFFLVLISLVTLSSCKKDNNGSSSGLDQIITTGTWRVSYFVESNEDNTADFSGYTFSFNSNGDLVATHSGVNTTGSWGWHDSSGKFNISIGSDKPISDLSDDWLVLEKTETLIRLKDDNTTKDELLNFTRN